MMYKVEELQVGNVVILEGVEVEVTAFEYAGLVCNVWFTCKEGAVDGMVRGMLVLPSDMEVQSAEAGKHTEVIDQFIEEVIKQEIAFFTELKEAYTTKELHQMLMKREIPVSTFDLATGSDLEGKIRKEYAVKKAKLLSKLEGKVGKVLACNLQVNYNGSFDGTITGTEGAVKIKTVIAGGHNIQRVHYRTIIK